MGVFASLPAAGFFSEEKLWLLLISQESWHRRHAWFVSDDACLFRKKHQRVRCKEYFPIFFIVGSSGVCFDAWHRKVLWGCYRPCNFLAPSHYLLLVIAVKSRIQEFGPAGLFSNEQNSTEFRVQTTYLIIGGLHFSYFFYWRRKLFPASYFISISHPHFLDVCTRCIKKYERACQDQYVT